MQPNAFPSYASQLEGLELQGGWRVTKKLEKPAGVTGGHFSIGYLAETSLGQRGFVKAIDYRSALQSNDIPSALSDTLNAYIFERKLCELCARRYMKHVVVALSHGTVAIEPGNPLAAVPYIVFELADGDIRKHLSDLQSFDLPWRVRMLHNIAVGLQQLHTAGVAHQDLKPSNVLIFNSRESKLADLGRACAKEIPSPHDHLLFSGDLRYAPPEVQYNFSPSEWNSRRYGADLFLLGNMIVFLFSRVTINALVIQKLDDAYTPSRWSGTFHEVLPHWTHAFGQAMAVIESDFPLEVRSELIECIRQLCEPNPDTRGHPEERSPGQNRHSVQRYVSRFDLLATRLELSTSTRK